MKKKLLSAAVVSIALGVTGTAQAANEYTISYSTNSTNSGTVKKPTAVSGKFGFSVKDTEGKRPFALDKLRVSFAGVRINTRQFATCSATSIERAQTDAGCPKASLVATGFANNIAGDINNRDDTSIRCYLAVKMYNSGSGKATLFVKGSPNASPSCPIEVATAIPVSITRQTTGDTLSFTIPDNLKNPLATLRNSLVETQLTLLKKTVRKSGRTVGYFETIGQCRKGRRTANVTFDNEGNNDVRQSGFARCTT